MKESERREPVSCRPDTVSSSAPLGVKFSALETSESSILPGLGRYPIEGVVAVSPTQPIASLPDELARQLMEALHVIATRELGTRAEATTFPRLRQPRAITQAATLSTALNLLAPYL